MMRLEIHSQDETLLQVVERIRQDADLVFCASDATSALVEDASGDPVLAIIDARFRGQAEVANLAAAVRARAALLLVLVDAQSRFCDLQAALPAENTDFLQWPCPACILATRLELIRARFAHIISGEKFDLAPQRREGRFWSATESLPIMVAAADPAGDLFVVNAAFRAFIGPERLQLTKGLEWQTWVHPDERDDMMAKFGAAIAFQQLAHVTVRVLRADGAWRWLKFTGSPFYDADATYAGTVVTLADVTEAKMLEERLRGSENMYRELAESLPLMISGIQSSGRVTFRNKASLEGFPGDVDLSDVETWSSFVHPADVARLGGMWEEALRHGAPIEQEARFLDPTTPAFRWLKVSLAPQRDAAGHVVFWICSFMDIDEDVRRTEELRWLLAELQKKSGEKREFLARLSHELRTPLNLILGHLYLLEGVEAKSAREEGARFQGIRRDAERILELVEKLPWPGDEPTTGESAAYEVIHVG